MTREDVKRQFTQYSACDPRECSKCADDALDRAVDEIVRLRAKLQAAREYASHLECCLTCAEDGINACHIGRELQDAAALGGDE